MRTIIMLVVGCLLSGFCHAQKEIKASPKPPAPGLFDSPEEVKEIFKKVDKMPVFQGCEDIEDANTKRNCGQQNLLQYVYKNLKYPAEARALRVQGMSVVSFVINKDGIVENPEIKRNLGYGTAEAAYNLIDKMQKEITWEPGEQGGKKVAVQYTLPLRFKLEGNEESYSFFKTNKFLDSFDGDIVIDKKPASREELGALNRSIKSINLLENNEAIYIVTMDRPTKKKKAKGNRNRPANF
jgi:TonB family protein